MHAVEICRWTKLSVTIDGNRALYNFDNQGVSKLVNGVQVRDAVEHTHAHVMYCSDAFP